MANYVNAVRNVSVQSAVGKITNDIEEQGREIEENKRKLAVTCDGIYKCESDTAKAEGRVRNLLNSLSITLNGQCPNVEETFDQVKSVHRTNCEVMNKNLQDCVALTQKLKTAKQLQETFKVEFASMCNLETQVRTAKEKLKAVEEREQAIEEMKRRKAANEDTCTELSRQIAVLEDDLHGMEKESMRIEFGKAALAKEIAELDKQILNRKQEVAEEAKSLDKKILEIEGLIAKETQDHEKALEDQKQEIAKLEDDNRLASEKMKLEEAKLNHAKIGHETNSKENVRLDRDIKKAKEKDERLQKQIDEATAKLSEQIESLLAVTRVNKKHASDTELVILSDIGHIFNEIKLRGLDLNFDFTLLISLFLGENITFSQLTKDEISTRAQHFLKIETDKLDNQRENFLRVYEQSTMMAEEFYTRSIQNYDSLQRMFDTDVHKELIEYLRSNPASEDGKVLTGETLDFENLKKRYLTEVKIYEAKKAEHKAAKTMNAKLEAAIAKDRKKLSKMEKAAQSAQGALGIENMKEASLNSNHRLASGVKNQESGSTVVRHERGLKGRNNRRRFSKFQRIKSKKRSVP